MEKDSMKEEEINFHIFANEGVLEMTLEYELDHLRKMAANMFTTCVKLKPELFNFDLTSDEKRKLCSRPLLSVEVDFLNELYHEEYEHFISCGIFCGAWHRFRCYRDSEILKHMMSVQYPEIAKSIFYWAKDVQIQHS